jgi:predicted ArsR family transcriptional regulator
MRVCGLDVDADRMTTPIARTTDPWTSHAGAVEVTDSGRRKTQAERCLDVVLTRPGLTAGEIGELTGLGHVPAQRRLSDLKAAGKVGVGMARQYLGRPQVTWWPTDRQGTLL